MMLFNFCKPQLDIGYIHGPDWIGSDSRYLFQSCLQMETQSRTGQIG